MQTQVKIKTTIRLYYNYNLFPKRSETISRMPYNLRVLENKLQTILGKRTRN